MADDAKTESIFWMLYIPVNLQLYNYETWLSCLSTMKLRLFAGRSTDGQSTRASTGVHTPSDITSESFLNIRAQIRGVYVH